MDDIKHLLVLFLERRSKWSVWEDLVRVLETALSSETTLDILTAGGERLPKGLETVVNQHLVAGEILEIQRENDESSSFANTRAIIDHIRSTGYDAALIFNDRRISPWTAAYLCYLGEIPVRIGISREFGGGVLSTCIDPPGTDVSGFERYHYLLDALELTETPRMSPE